MAPPQKRERKKHMSSWQDTIPMVAIGGTFESDDLFYCKGGSYIPIRTEEEYIRAQQVVTRYPGNYRILRYEGRGYIPCLYEVGSDVEIRPYVHDGQGKIPVSNIMRTV